MIKVNAQLSRQVSQTFTGTSPILDTGSCFHAHSLLGIGTASFALMSISSFLQNSLVKGSLFGRINALKNEDAIGEKQLFELFPNDEKWRAIENVLSNIEVEDDDEEELPLLTCFSGRDGFRSTSLSLSAPVEAIGSCNTDAWNLLTMTHEFSHTVIDTLLGEFDFDASDEVAMNSLALSIKGQPTTLYDQARAMLGYGTWLIHWSKSQQDPEDYTSKLLAESIESQWDEVNEILTHCFDFMYFYHRDSERYVHTIWRSWDMNPGIEDRIPEYLVRSLCALHTSYADINQGGQTTIDQLSAHLSDLKGSDNPPKLCASRYCRIKEQPRRLPKEIAATHGVD